MTFFSHTLHIDVHFCVAVMTNEMMLTEKLKAHPEITKRMLALIAITEAESGSFDRADAAEDAVVTHVRKLGNELMSDWGTFKEAQKLDTACQLHPDAVVRKKTFFGRPPLAK